jgi:hypothetical protein
VRQAKTPLTLGMNVAHGAAALAAQVLMGIAGVGIVALGAALGGDLENLAERRQLAKDVVDRGATDLGEARRRPRDELVDGSSIRIPKTLRGSSRVCYRRVEVPR